MIIFNRAWVNRAMSNLWEEMVGVRKTLPARTLGQQPPAAAPGDVDLGYAEKWIPFSELRAARLIDLQMGNRITYTGDDRTGSWYFWNGVYHQEVDSGIIADYACEAFADQMVEAMNQVEMALELVLAAMLAANGWPANSTSANDARKRLWSPWKEHIAFQKQLHSDSGLNALKSRFRKQVTESRAHFEDDRRWLVCMNGVIDLEKFRQTFRVADSFLPHSPERKVTRSIACDFNPDAKAPVWDHFLETSIPDEEIRDYLQKLVGAAFLAESKVKTIPNLQGPKDCGKTMFVSTLEELAGGYGAQPSPKALMKEQGQNFEQDHIRGKRFIGISEPSTTDRLDDTFCKQVTGGDLVSTRTLNKASSPWLPQCVIFIASNEPVKFNTTDAAFVERLALIRFPHQFYSPLEAEPGEIHLKDPDLEHKLAAEYEGIFLWVIVGMWKYLTQGGAKKPESIKRAGDDYVVDTSGPLTWVREKVDQGLLVVADKVSDHPISHYATLQNLYGAYAMETHTNFEKPMTRIRFSNELASKYGRERSGVTRITRLIGTGMWANMHSNQGV